MDGESTNHQDARIEDLFRALDVEKKGYLDLENLQAGFKRIDHPLKNAVSLIEDILDRIDTDHDGHITYQEFHTFVKHMEDELLALFESIDRNHDGSLAKDELQIAFRRAGLTVSSLKLEEFINAIDVNHDGEVSFEEWRNFLLFLPTHVDSDVNLENILSYYSQTTSVRLGTESDVIVEAAGTGTDIMSFLRPFFAMLFLVGQRPPPRRPKSWEYVDTSSRPIEYTSVAEPKQINQQTRLLPEVTAAEPVVLPPIDWTTWESIRPMLIGCVPSTGYFAAGAIAGTVSRTATAPLDRLKVYLIAQTKVSTNTLMASHGVFGLLRIAKQNTVAAFKDLWRAGGLRSLYAGNGINIAKVMPETAIRFGFFEGAKRVLAKAEGHNNPRKLSSPSKMLAGGIGGVASQFIVYPLDTLKFRMQCETVEGGLHGNKLIWATAKKMWKTGGIRCFYKGLVPGLVGVFPYAAIDMGTFEYIKMRIVDHKASKFGIHEDDAGPSSATTAGIGAFTGALGATIVYPVNLVRTRLQTQGTVLHPRTYKGFWDATSITIKGEGIRGLFKGLTPNLIKVVPAVSITYVVYENAKSQWGLK